MDLIYPEESYCIRGAAFEVYNHIGCGFPELVYQECLEKEFQIRRLPFVAQPELKIEYKGWPLKKTFKPDFICYDKIIVEIKALNNLAPEHESQVLNYLKATGMKLGFLINFGEATGANAQRIVL